MQITDDQIQSIIYQVLQNVTETDSFSHHESESNTIFHEQWGVFKEMTDAVEAAHEAFRAYQKFSLQDRKIFVDTIRQMTLDHKEEFSRMAVEQTKMGRVEHKIAKHINVAKHASGIEYLQPRSWAGKNGLAVEEYVPWGVIGNISPSTHPSPAMIENIIIQLSAGNTITFNQHPIAKKLNAMVIQKCNRYMSKVGAPANLVTCVAEPTMESAQVLFEHKQTKLLSITGGPGVVAAAMKTNKPVIAAGPGNPPVLVDDTADLAYAAKEITQSSSFDNNILCLAEKEIFVVDSVFNDFIKQMAAQNNVIMTPSQMDQLADKALELKGKHYLIGRDYVGRNANRIAQILGKQISENVPLLVGETSKDHPWVVAEQMTPCIPVIRVKNFEEGVEAARKAEHGFEHTSSVFTQNMERATLFCKTLNTNITVVNGGSIRGNGGDEGEAYFSHTIASPTGQSVVTPRDFCKRRRIMQVGAFSLM